MLRPFQRAVVGCVGSAGATVGVVDGVFQPKARSMPMIDQRAHSRDVHVVDAVRIAEHIPDGGGDGGSDQAERCAAIAAEQRQVEPDHRDNRDRQSQRSGEERELQDRRDEEHEHQRHGANDEREDAGHLQLLLGRRLPVRDVEVAHHERGDGERDGADADENRGDQRGGDEAREHRVHALHEHGQRVEAVHIRVEILSRHADQGQDDAQREAERSCIERRFAGVSGALGARNRLDDELRRKDGADRAEGPGEDRRKADLAIPSEVEVRQFRLHRRDPAGQRHSDVEDDRDAGNLDGAVQDRDIGDAFKAAEHVVECADNGDDARRDRQVDLERSGDCCCSANVVANIHQQ